MLVFCVANQKGGVGKTATADALATYLSRPPLNARVLAVDLDPQCNLTASFGLNPYEKAVNIRDVLLGTVTAKEAVTNARAAIIRGSMLTSALEDALKGPAKHLTLQEALKPLESDFDCIVIDTPPGVGLGTTNALFAADAVIIPAAADMFTLQGVQELLNNVKYVQGHRPGLQVGGIFFTRHNPRSNLTQYAAQNIRELAEKYGARVLDAYTRECIAVKEAAALSQSIFEYAPKSNAAIDYQNIFDELFETKKEG